MSIANVITAIVLSFAAIVPAYTQAHAREGAVVWCYLS